MFLPGEPENRVNRNPSEDQPISRFILSWDVNRLPTSDAVYKNTSKDGIFAAPAQRSLF